MGALEMPPAVSRCVAQYGATNVGTRNAALDGVCSPASGIGPPRTRGHRRRRGKVTLLHRNAIDRFVDRGQVLVLLEAKKRFIARSTRGGPSLRIMSLARWWVRRSHCGCHLLLRSQAISKSTFPKRIMFSFELKDIPYQTRKNLQLKHFR